jgi:hypothetical protein
MSKQWKICEENSFIYLQQNISDKSISFEYLGSENSREVDIKVFKNQKFCFAIESKYIPSQCGQFVVEQRGDKLVESNANFNINSITPKILNELNVIRKNLNVELVLSEGLIAEWIEEHYRSKEVRFFIFSKEVDRDFRIIPIEKISSYFKFTCMVRKKKSGSRDLPKSERESSYLQLERFINLTNNRILDFTFDGKSTYVKTINPVESNYFNNNTLFLSQISENHYRIKKLSSTNNLTVIFSMDLDNLPEDSGLVHFQSTMNKISC